MLLQLSLGQGPLCRATQWLHAAAMLLLPPIAGALHCAAQTAVVAVWLMGRCCSLGLKDCFKPRADVHAGGQLPRADEQLSSCYLMSHYTEAA